ncbi:hypothetical protein BGZ97_008383 [Linnemannia gamsii]|jgi:hypothetical protein|uniref:Uncharacterized protein n=1 Tax=Linnemannia gamsii TaxID=64522 RepID=A0A9P6RAH9_9FUNG|nr:hypothetical protein BGZ97_008383 [Linnemannia gamsii]
MMLKSVTSLAVIAALAISQVVAQDTQSAGSNPTVEAYDADIGDNTKWYPGGWYSWGYPYNQWGWGWGNPYYRWGYGRRIWW